MVSRTSFILSRISFSTSFRKRALKTQLLISFWYCAFIETASWLVRVWFDQQEANGFWGLTQIKVHYVIFSDPYFLPRLLEFKPSPAIGIKKVPIKSQPG
jgi:hypothetical protein